MLFIAIYSIGETSKYDRENRNADFRLLATSPEIPGVSILAPAYNEGLTIIENVRSLLSIHYGKFEVIVINDGSLDNSLEQLIDVFKLYKVEYFFQRRIKTKQIRDIYKSRHPTYRKLLVLDKENGGKADALNAGINAAFHDLIVCVDVDCILRPEALIKLVKPFLEATKKRVIASGGGIRISNGCKIENGKLTMVKLSGQFLPCFQTLEYIRAFLFARMAWCRLNGLLLISGALGAFDKEIVIKCGGYNHHTVGEDMELIVRMRRYMEERHEPYKVIHIPDPLCWTEAPATYTILGRQRNRWMRGTIETLRDHKVMFFNPRYKFLGMVSYPYWFFFEFLAPVMAFIGMTELTFQIIFGSIDWRFFLSIFFLLICFGLLYSLFALMMEIKMYHQYMRPREILKLMFAAALEPLLFQPFLAWSAIQGIFDLFQKKKTWGIMTRQGFTSE
jgi:cellulose synthase/poly-beta-1,6-N-acetylglucosamine synthase-like glycosyltransferase